MKKFKYNNFAKKIVANFCTQTKIPKRKLFYKVFKKFTERDDIEDLCYNKELLPKFRVK